MAAGDKIVDDLTRGKRGKALLKTATSSTSWVALLGGEGWSSPLQIEALLSAFSAATLDTT